MPAAPKDVPQILPGLLGARDRVVVATTARAAAKRGGVEAGRQGTGYEKTSLMESMTAERLGKKCLKAIGDPALYDAWLLRYPVGSEIPEHTDPTTPGM